MLVEYVLSLDLEKIRRWAFPCDGVLSFQVNVLFDENYSAEGLDGIDL